jgi:hypothetical protein
MLSRETVAPRKGATPLLETTLRARTWDRSRMRPSVSPSAACASELSRLKSSKYRTATVRRSRLPATDPLCCTPLKDPDFPHCHAEAAPPNKTTSDAAAMRYARRRDGGGGGTIRLLRVVRSRSTVRNC